MFLFPVLRVHNTIKITNIVHWLHILMRVGFESDFYKEATAKTEALIVMYVFMCIVRAKHAGMQTQKIISESETKTKA